MTAQPPPSTTTLPNDATSPPSHPIHSNDWWSVYGEPRPRTPALPHLEVDDVAKWVQDGSDMRPGVEFLIVDVRRGDCETMIPTAINLPAHSLPRSLPALIPLLARVGRIAVHCNSSKGRGTRAAGWIADALDEYYDNNPPPPMEMGERCQVYILKGGINAWRQRFGEETIENRGSRERGKGLLEVRQL